MEQEIFAAIGQYAFPIVMCLLMGKYLKYREDQHTKAVSELNAQHQKEMDGVTQAINNNTLAVQRLTDFMEVQASDKN